MVMLPGGVLPGALVVRSMAMKKKLSGSGFQVRAVFAPEVLLTRVMFRWNRVPEPESGVKSFEKAEMRSVLIGPPPGRTLPDTFQLLPVSPAPEIGGLWKVTIEELNVKSPWNPTSPSAGLIVEVTTG